MSTPHQAVTAAIAANVYEFYDHQTITAETTAYEVLEALRVGAVRRMIQAVRDNGGSYTLKAYVDAILGPPPSHH